MIKNNIIIYFIILLAALSVWFIKNEEVILILHLVFLLSLIYLLNINPINIILFSICLTIALYVSSKYFNLFKFNNEYTTYTIPLWIPFTWAIVGIFAYYVINLNLIRK